MKIAIIGGGFTGLAASLKLSQKGFETFLFEKENNLGGLSAGFKLPSWEWTAEEHYHHLFTSDKNAINLLKEIGMEKELFFKRPKTAVYYDPSVIAKNEVTKQSHGDCHTLPIEGLAMTKNNIYPFNSALDLLNFPFLSIIEKIRAGIIILFLKITPFWKPLEKVTAYEWLNKFMGKRAFEVLFKPLFAGKFGSQAEKINMAWFWARIKKRSSSLGYVKGGFQKFADELGNGLNKNGGKIFLGTEILEIKKEKEKIALFYKKDDLIKKELFDKVISTIPTKNFLKIIPSFSSSYKDNLLKIEHLDSLNLVLILRKAFLEKTYWLNINDKSFPFLAVVEHGNFTDVNYYGKNHIVYVGNYLPKKHEYFDKSKEELLEIFDPYLSKINPDYRKNLIDFKVFRGSNGQTIVPTNYSLLKPDFKNPIENLYIANLDMVYPWDRGTNFAIEMGERIAKLISN